jgi:antitoxin VapB
MKVTTVFTNGPSTQAVRIPKEFRFNTQEVWIEKVPEGLLIRPKPASWDDFFNKTPRLTDDFSTERKQQSPQKRDDF